MENQRVVYVRQTSWLQIILMICILAVLLFIGLSLLRNGGAAQAVDGIAGAAKTIYVTATPVPRAPTEQIPQVPVVHPPVVVQPQGMPALPHVEPTAVPTPEVIRVVPWGAGGGWMLAAGVVAGAMVASIAAWRLWPTPTPLPEPGQPGFVESFQPAQCSPLVGYLPGHPCYGHVPTLVPTPSALPQPGEDGFVESFK